MLSIRFLSARASPEPKGTLGLQVPLDDERVSRKIISFPGMWEGS